jgi:clan AA aspartic protease
MNGFVDGAGRALIDVSLLATRDGAAKPIAAWIDTGFTGELVLPQSMIDGFGLTLTGTVSAVLADGSKVNMKTYRCFVHWFDQMTQLEVVANKGQHPLLGVGLLRNHELRIDYRTGEIELD